MSLNRLKSKGKNNKKDLDGEHSGLLEGGEALADDDQQAIQDAIDRQRAFRNAMGRQRNFEEI